MKKLENQTAFWLVRIAIWVAAAIPLVLLPYVVWFWGRGASISNDPAHWGAFGDYVGGLLGPMLSAVALLGLAASIALQTEQIKSLKLQAGLDEMQRLIATYAERLDGELRRDLRALPIVGGQGNVKLGLGHVLAGVGGVAADRLVKGLPVDQDWEFIGGEEEAREIRDAVSFAMLGVLLDMESMCWVLIRYEEEGGSRLVAEFYRRTYLSIAVWSFALGLLTSHARIRQFFDPESSLGLFRLPEGELTRG